MTSSDPQTVEEAMAMKYADKWKEAIQSEMVSLQDHDTWQIVQLPREAKTLDPRFVFRRKLLKDGTVGKYKARLVVRGFMQGTIENTYTPVVDITTIRVALTIAVQRNFVIHQMDVKTAFWQGVIDEIVYVILPDGYGIELQSGQALKLKKGLYGLKQAPRLWYEKWSSVIKTDRIESTIRRQLPLSERKSMDLALRG